MNGRAWALAGFWLGVSSSVAGNVGHTYIAHNPPVGAVLASCFWPLSLLVSLEVISRVTWPVGLWWWLTRYAGLTTVAFIAASLSYRHMASLLSSYGEDWFSAHAGPASVDGLMFLCSAALLAIADNRKRMPIIGRVEV